MHRIPLLGWIFASTLAEAAPPRRYTALAAGDAFVCAVDADGRVWCWGDNRNGQLGGGSPEPFVGSPSLVTDLTDVVQVAAARFWAAAVRRDGTVWTWGDDGFGRRTGDPKAPLAGPRPTRVRGLDRVKQLALGEHHGCALRDDGTVWCWGWDYYGRLGDAQRFFATQPANPTPIPVPQGPMPGRLMGEPADRRSEPSFPPTPVPGIARASTIAAFGARTAAIVDGAVWMWGNAAALAESGQMTPVTAADLAPRAVDGLSAIRAIALGPRRHLAVHSDGRVLGFGDLFDGGRNTTPIAPGVVQYTGIDGTIDAATHYGAIVRRGDGTLTGWGNLRGDGQPAGGPPSRLDLRATAITAGRDFACAIDPDAQLWGWGAGWAGQLGVPPGRTIGASADWTADRPIPLFHPK
jgi:alpha-tubulin suppressor-like RCC1 family protein